MSADAVRPRLTVLIVNWNSWHHLLPCINAIHASDFRDLDILVVDNASNDRSAEKIEHSFPGVRLIRNNENVGHTRAVNQGFRLAAADLILLLDADTEVAADTIGLMVRFLDAHPEVDLLAPRTLNSDGTIQETARNFPGAVSGLFGRQGLLTRMFPDNPFSRGYLLREHLDALQPFRVESIASSCMLLRRSLIDRLGEWDEGYPGYFVDTDWCYRLRRSDIKVYCVPAARIVHHEQNKRTRKRSPQRIWMFHQGAYRFYRKNMTLGWLDPRAVLAGLALASRALLLIGCNALKPDIREAPPVAAVPQVDELSSTEER